MPTWAESVAWVMVSHAVARHFSSLGDACRLWVLAPVRSHTLFIWAEIYPRARWIRIRTSTPGGMPVTGALYSYRYDSSAIHGRVWHSLRAHVSSLQAGVLHVQIVLSHWSMETYTGTPYRTKNTEWYLMQLRTTMRMAGHRLVWRRVRSTLGGAHAHTHVRSRAWGSGSAPVPCECVCE